MNRKGFAPLIIVLVAAAILIGGGIWYYKANQSTAIPNIEQVATSTSGSSPAVNPLASSTLIEGNSSSVTSTKDWQVYQNNQYKFSFKYPQGWRVQTIPSGAVKLSLSVDQPSDDSGNNGITINVSSDTLASKINYLQAAVSINDSHKEEIDGEQWTVLTYKMDGMNLDSTSFLVQSGDLLFQIAGFNSDQNKLLIPQIIDTFRITQ